MIKIFLIGSALITSVLADNNLGNPINETIIDKVIEKQTITKQTISKQSPTKSYKKHYTKTIVPTSKMVTNTHTFKKDHHRYDKRYNNFDYSNSSYYNDDGYYYGYYDNSGYFYNNIFFTYNSLYTYDDRRYRQGYFTPRHRHNRVYRHHRGNNWNRVHCYREPNHIVYGDYYDRRHYPSRYRQNYNYNYNYRDNARMTLPRRNYNINQSNNGSSIRNHNTRTSQESRNYNNNRSYNNLNQRNHINRNYNSGARMTIHRNTAREQHRSRPKRSSAPKQQQSSGSSYMQMSK